ncbi:MAG: ribosome-binding factor [Verrucomicrobiaceae bacterium]|nr:ribosome-binding factor [Verrucomicrobiaceae bacterium]
MTHRLQRVQELIRRELATVLERNYTFDGLLLTLHEVTITPDLRSCRVWVGVLGGKTWQQEAAIEKLRTNRGMIQNELFKRVKLKHSPQLFFRLDKSIERGVRIVQAIDNLPPIVNTSDEPAPPFREPGKKKEKLEFKDDADFETRDFDEDEEA